MKYVGYATSPPDEAKNSLLMGEKALPYLIVRNPVRLSIRMGRWKTGKCADCDTIGTYWEWEDEKPHPHYCEKHNPRIVKK